MSATDLSRRIDELERRVAVLEGRGAANSGALGSELSAARTMPVLEHGRRPSWWSDTEVARFVTSLHRAVELDRAVALCREIFGAERAPSRTSIGNYWKKLDELVRRSRP